MTEQHNATSADFSHNYFLHLPFHRLQLTSEAGLSRSESRQPIRHGSPLLRKRTIQFAVTQYDLNVVV